jgi:hypothetical protein
VEGGETPVEAVEAEMFGQPVFEFVFTLRGVSCCLGGEGGGEEGRTVSRDWMYFTCGSMVSWSSSGREEEPARPGPETSDILEGWLSFRSWIGGVEENVVRENGDALG